ncbi:MAG: adenine phosphoribosyltransferase [Proteobacteria bacterium]|nr:adenine phosphoribosyltransferase [Pseudomonadota bacterium]
MKTLESYIRTIPDFPKAGILFRDITPLLAHPPAYAEVIQLLLAAAPKDTTHVAAIEARGFLFAPAVAAALQVGFVPIRKPGKLPAETVVADYTLEYGTNQLAMHRDAVKSGDRVYLIDDLIATGGSLAAALSLIHTCGATVNHIACLIELVELGGREKLAPYLLTALLRY